VQQRGLAHAALGSDQEDLRVAKLLVGRLLVAVVAQRGERAQRVAEHALLGEASDEVAGAALLAA